MEALRFFLDFVKTALKVFVVVGGVVAAASAAPAAPAAPAAAAGGAAAAGVAVDRVVVFFLLSLAVGLPVNAVIRHTEVGASLLLLLGQFFFRILQDM